MSCPHTSQLENLNPPMLSQSVHREECTQCFDNQDLADGIEVCLICFNGGCLSQERRHARIHVQRTGHTFTLNVKRRARSSPQRVDYDEPPPKMTKLATMEEHEEDKYEHVTTLKCWTCDPDRGNKLASSPKIVDKIMQSLSSARQPEVKAWKEEITACEHTSMIEQFATGHIAQSSRSQIHPLIGQVLFATCNFCDLKENLWLCIICGSLGCGRRQFGGLGGNGHGLQHFQETNHSVSVKLGTITPEGPADIYCYLCNDAKEVPELAKHLSTFGINIQMLTKTEKSMAELQIEHNLKYNLSFTGDGGKALEPVFGPGLTGLANLGNSCYMASILQIIFSLPQFQRRYLESSGAAPHATSCTVPLPADCIECQMHKIADGLLSGRYSHPAHSADASVFPPPETLQHPSLTPVFQTGVKPTNFKALVGKGHEEFDTISWQDAEEFFMHLITVIRRDGQQKYRERSEPDPTAVFSHSLEQRLECTSCRKVSYRTDVTDVVSVSIPPTQRGTDADGKAIYEEVKLTDFIRHLLRSEVLDYSCPSCGTNDHAVKSTKFASLPEVLVIHTKKFQLVNGVPAKLDIPVILPDNDELTFTEAHLSKGLQDREIEQASQASSQPQFNEAAMSELEGMGFPTIHCQKALLATGNSDAVSAMEWLFAHMKDSDIDAPIVASSASSAPEPDLAQVSSFVDMGFTSAQAKKALRETSGNPERAMEWLFSHPDDDGSDASTATSTPQSSVISGLKDVPAQYRLLGFVSHKGPSIYWGHYVAHVKKGDQWVLFNDEKVVKADAESVKKLKKLAYLYFFVRA